MHDVAVANDIEQFIARWTASSGNERANFQSFTNELCALIGVERPRPSDSGSNDYAFERKVGFSHLDSGRQTGWIDLYKKHSFIMEAKQSREKGRPKAMSMPGQLDLLETNYHPRGQRSANRAWDQLMISARRQAEDYARALPPSHGWPPFVLVCDIGHCIEVYADFSGQGKNYAQFPDRQNFRIYMQDLHDAKIRDRLKRIWDNPADLDPARHSAKVTREIAKRLAEVSKALEKRGEHKAEDVALFLMRCLFTMFAEDVELLPKASFQQLLQKCAADPSKFVRMVTQLWQAMDTGEFAFAIEQKVVKFNGKLFKGASAIPLQKEEIGELLAAARADWREVEPAIFGTLLEQALDEKERARLGAHYTPRAYVERLIVVTMIEPLRQEWAQVQATAERLKEEKQARDAIGVVRDFHAKLCATRVLDPACGTGNFLYVALELMKRLEGEVLEALVDLGGQEALGLEKQTVDPHQFLGLELNPRAAAIAELVIWLGYLQWHFRTKASAPSEPILRDFQNITVMDAVLTWDGWPIPGVVEKDGKRVLAYPNARRPDWPETDYIVGNPPFIGGKDIRAALADETQALWRAHPHIGESADFVMYWWDRAAEIVADGKAKRFGFVTTNSITQVFSRRVVARHLANEKKPLSLLMAIPDHPWTKATDNAAAVRIAMTVAAAGRHEGVLRKVTREARLDTDQPEIELSATAGRINSDLTAGVDVGSGLSLRASEGLGYRGVQLISDGFIVTPQQAAHLGLGKRPGLEKHIREYRNGRDLTSIPRGVMVIDMLGLDADELRQKFPEVYQHILTKVKPERDANRRASYAANWWVFGEPRRELRPALAGLLRYIVTVETAKHRVFVFLDGSILPDNMLVAVGSDDAFHLGVLSSGVHVTWALRAGGWLGVGNDPRYSKSRCFDPFPFPDCDDALKARIRTIGEELDAHRKARQAEHPGLTLTQMYNVLEKLKAGEALSADDERIREQGLVLILKEHHDRLDALVFEAYGWPATLTDEDILERLVALNTQRFIEEKTGNVRWLRPDYQIPRFGSDAEKARLAEEKRLKAADDERMKPKQGALLFEDDLREMKKKFPTGDELAETVFVMRVLEAAPSPVTIEQIAQHFAQGKAIEKRVSLVVSALARLGHLSTENGGKSVSLRTTETRSSSTADPRATTPATQAPV